MFFLVVYQGSGIFGTLSPIIVFVLWSIRARDFIRVPGFLDFCLPSLCFFLWFIRAPRFLEPCLPSLCLFCGPSGRGTSSGFRDSWTFVSHHCVSSGSGTCLPSSRTCLPGSGTCGTLSPIIVFFLVVYEGSGFLEIPNSRACWVSISRAGAGSRGLAAFKIRNGTLELEPWNWNPGTLEPWNPGTLKPWNPKTLETRNLGTLEPWDPGTPEFWNPGPGTLERLERLEPWNPEP